MIIVHLLSFHLLQIQLVLKAHHVSIFLSHPKSQEIVNVTKPKIHIPNTSGIAGEVARTGKIIACVFVFGYSPPVF